MRAVRILFVEDRDNDVQTALAILKQAQFSVTHLRVYSERQLRAALEIEWDLAIVDHHLPGYDAEKALTLIRAIQPYLAVVVVSGIVRTEEMAQLVQERMGRG